MTVECVPAEQLAGNNMPRQGSAYPGKLGPLAATKQTQSSLTDGNLESYSGLVAYESIRFLQLVSQRSDNRKYGCSRRLADWL